MEHGRCTLPINALAAMAGVGRTTVQNALRLASRLGFLACTARRQTRNRNLPNLVRITSKEWMSWLTKRGRGVGTEKRAERASSFKKEGYRAEALGQILGQRPPISAPPMIGTGPDSGTEESEP